jgi:hypothetical protein
MQGWGIARRRSSVKRLNAAADPKFFNQFVRRYPDKQYQTWLGAHYTMVGVDYTYEKELQDRIFAGIANYFFGYSFTSAMKLTKDKPRSNEIPPFEQKFDSVELAFYSTARASCKLNDHAIFLMDMNWLNTPNYFCSGYLLPYKQLGV